MSIITFYLDTLLCVLTNCPKTKFDGENACVVLYVCVVQYRT